MAVIADANGAMETEHGLSEDEATPDAEQSPLLVIDSGELQDDECRVCRSSAEPRYEQDPSMM
jgi:hypothetical protein